MIKLNDKEYNNYKVDVRWGTFVACSQGQKRTGLSPFLTFCLNGEIFIGLELSFSYEMFENLENGVETNIDRYVTDITFEDESGWLSIYNGKHRCTVTKIAENEFKLCLEIRAKDLDEEFNITIEHIVKAK